MQLRLIKLVTLCAVISACASNSAKNVSLEGFDQSKVNRANELYACSNFFRIVGTQRKKQEEIDRYIKLTEQAKNLGNGLIAAADNDPNSLDNGVADTLYKQGGRQAIEMVKAIGKDKTGTKFKDTTLSCYKLVQKEELFENVGILNQRLNKNND